jgi:hypothetical protein
MPRRPLSSRATDPLDSHEARLRFRRQTLGERSPLAAHDIARLELPLFAVGARAPDTEGFANGFRFDRAPDLYALIWHVHVDRRHDPNATPTGRGWPGATLQQAVGCVLGSCGNEVEPTAEIFSCTPADVAAIRILIVAVPAALAGYGEVWARANVRLQPSLYGRPARASLTRFRPARARPPRASHARVDSHGIALAIVELVTNASATVPCARLRPPYPSPSGDPYCSSGQRHDRSSSAFRRMTACSRYGPPQPSTIGT